jgi:hypothetical protein
LVGAVGSKSLSFPNGLERAVNNLPPLYLREFNWIEEFIKVVLKEEGGVDEAEGVDPEERLGGGIEGLGPQSGNPKSQK